MADILETFVEELKTAYGANLKSVILYGSKASGEETGKSSDYNLLVVLDKVAFDDLKIDGIIPKWIRRGNPAPMLFSREMLERSADVFPIEFLDMKDAHRVLYGEDVLDSLAVHDTNLRHECEYELKSQLLKLRQGYMSVHRSGRMLQKLMAASVSSVLVVFKHAARLLGERPSVKKMESLSDLRKRVDITPGVFATIRKMKAGDREALRLDPHVVFKEYLHQIEKVVDAVDKI